MELTRYQKMVIHLRTTPAQTLAINYNVKANYNLFDLATKVSDFTVYKSNYNSSHFVLIFSIQIYEIKEKIEFIGTIEDITIRSQVFLSWINSEEGAKQLEEDVLKQF